MKKRIISSLIWLLYAYIWLTALVSLASVLIMVRSPEQEFYLEDWQAALFMGVVGVVWLIVLWRRLSWRLALCILMFALVAAALFNAGTVYPYTVGGMLAEVAAAIGIGKLIIQLVGRRNVLARSRLRANEISVSPRGLVEYESRH